MKLLGWTFGDFLLSIWVRTTGSSKINLDGQGMDVCGALADTVTGMICQFCICMALLLLLSRWAIALCETTLIDRYSLNLYPFSKLQRLG